MSAILRWSPMAVLLAATAAVDIAAAGWVLRRRGAVGRRSLALMLLAAAAWCLAYALELATVARPARETFGSLELVGTALLPPAWLLFALTYTGHRERPGRRLLAVLAAEPLALWVLIALPATHDLVRSLAPGPTARVPLVQLGPLFWVHFAWTTALTLAATAVLVVRLTRLTSAYRRQTVILATAAAVPLLGNAASTLGVPGARTYDPTPLAVSAGALVLVWGAFRHHLLDLVPIARTLAFERLGDPILVVDVLGRIVDRNAAAVRLLGDGAQLGATLQHLLQRHAALVDATWAGAEIRIGDGAADREYELVASTVEDRRGHPAGRLVHLRDVTERKAAERHLRFLAENDALTGLPNRRLLSDRLGQAIARAQRSQGLCALLLLDLDRFKLINDTFGHPTGDRVLQEVADRLRAGRRDEDTVARLSGDEFAVLLPEVASVQDAATVAGRALAAVAEPMHLDGLELHVTASAGVAVWPDDGWDARQLFGRVDAAMYRAKRSGRNQARAREPTAAVPARDGAGRGDLAADLPGAVERDELRLMFQPVVDLAEGTVTAMEAQLCWQHPRHGEVRGAAFLPVADELGLAARIDRWLLAEACGQACRWIRGGRRVPVCVRASADRLRPGGTRLSSDVALVLARTALPAELLVLQLGERDIAEHPASAAVELRALHALGVGLTLIDFGADHTSLTDLRRLPLDSLTLDHDLVEAARSDDGGLRVLTAVTTLAHLLGMTVIAPGVERPDMVPVLRRIGCDAALGSLFSRPVDADTADILVTAPAAGGAVPRRPVAIDPPGTDAPRPGMTVTSGASSS